MQTTKIALSFVALLAFTSPALADTVVTLSFDDTLADQVQVGDLLAARGLHATFFVNSPRLDQASYMTTAQVTALQAAGNEIAGHTVNHLSLMTMTTDEQRRQICNDRAALLGMGFHITTFAYPHGAEDLATHAIVTDCGYNAARDASSLRSHDPETCPTCAYAETMPPRDPLAIRTPVSIKSNITLADLQLSVTDAEAHGGGWVPFVFHHVCDGCNSLAISPAILTQFLDWLAARAPSGTTVKTFQDVIAGPLNAAVPGPAATQYVAADGNLLHNASMEDDLDADQVPDCWLIGSGGSDASTYTSGAAPAAHSGAYAEQISVVAGQVSSPRILSFQDLGACAPGATTGHTYKLSAYYQSSDPAVLVAYYRNSLGWWKFWGQSPVLAAASSWTLAEWTTAAAPAEATAISVGISLVSTGTLSVDDIRLVDPDAPAVGSDAGTTPDDAALPAVADLGSDPGTMSSSGGCEMSSAAPVGAFALLALFCAAMLSLLRRRRA